MTQNWNERAEKLIHHTLSGVNIELNELDWKEKLSTKNERLSEHLSAFSNNPDGGFLVFGITNDATVIGVDTDESIEIVNRIGHLARTSLSQSIMVSHHTLPIQGKYVLVIYIEETTEKPVYKKGKMMDCYKRSACQTVKMTEQEIRNMMASSLGITFEKRVAKKSLTASEILENYLDYEAYHKLAGKKIAKNTDLIISGLDDVGFIKRGSTIGKWDITNLGALLLAKDIAMFGLLRRKAVRVIVYKDNTKNTTIKEQIGGFGYAVGFSGLIKFIMNLLPQNEVIENALRKSVKMYPEIAIRELVANALIHQDLSIIGSSVMVEIFSDRIEISNPGIPIVPTNRFIDSHRSRNEDFADLMKRLSICEERGSGVDKVIANVEVYQLPAPKFIQGEDFTKVILYSHTAMNKMGKEDKIRACYQHCALNAVNNKPTNNESIRKRFNIAEKNYPMASRIISDTIEAGLIKSSDTNGTSKKYMTYIPFWL